MPTSKMRLLDDTDDGQGREALRGELWGDETRAQPGTESRGVRKSSSEQRLQRRRRPLSAPPHTRPRRRRDLVISPQMLSTSSRGLAFDSEEWNTPPLPARLYRAASVGSWGVTSTGRGFQWEEPDNSDPVCPPKLDISDPSRQTTLDAKPPEDHNNHTSRTNAIETPKIMRLVTNVTPISATTLTPNLASGAFCFSPMPSRTSSPVPSVGSQKPGRSPSTPRPRRRSSQQRVSLIAGRVSIATIEPSSPVLPHSLHRADSSSSFLSTASSTRAPSPADNRESFLGAHTISDFEIEGEIGRGAYGLVKRAREIRPDGSLGVR